MSKCRMLLPVLLFVGAAAAANLTYASDWPRFRGPNGAGIANDRTIPVTWTEKEILWKVPLPGPGNSSPVTWKGRLFTQCTSKDGSERMLVCLDTKDGSVAWVEKVKGTTFKALHANNTLASSSPAVDAQRVYAAFWDGVRTTIHAYGHDGKPLWSKDLGAFVSQHGAGASPIVSGDKVYFNNDHDKGAEFFCLDAKTGDTVWSAKRPFFRACYSAPLLRTLPSGKQELVLATTKGITGYDPDSGNVNWNWVWNFKGMQLRTTASPVYDNGIVFAPSGDGASLARRMVAIRIDGPPTLVWENLKHFPYVPTMLVYGKHLYFVNDTGFAGCFESETGKQAWYERLEGEFFSSPIVVDGKIYAANADGDVFVFAADPGGFKLLARNSLGETMRATPAVADERMYLRGDLHMYCIGKR
jgi:outer membrane protein assembly factor BamB